MASSIFATEEKWDDWALGAFLISAFFLATISFWKGFPNPPEE